MYQSRYSIQISEDFAGSISIQNGDGKIVFSLNGNKGQQTRQSNTTTTTNAAPAKQPINSKRTTVSKNTPPSKYVLDFNTKATSLLASQSGKYLEVHQIGSDLCLVPFLTKTANSSHIICDKGGNTVSATFTPKVFTATSLRPDMRYEVISAGSNFILKPTHPVLYEGQRIRYDYPVVSVSYDRSV